jgi:hypothetical protein
MPNQLACQMTVVLGFLLFVYCLGVPALKVRLKFLIDVEDRLLRHLSDIVFFQEAVSQGSTDQIEYVLSE